MDNCTLVLLAAGKGSRYGGLKQVKQFGCQKRSLAEFAAHDALLCEFSRIVFVVNELSVEYFQKVIAENKTLRDKCVCVQQRIDDIPIRSIGVNREKPWGTAHALLTARNFINGPFVVINGDDFYGRNAYELSREFFLNDAKDLAMVAYRLKNTLSDNGTVSRAVCTKKGDWLSSISEFTKLSKRDSGKIVDENTTAEFVGDELVSVNFWCLRQNIFDHINSLFCEFLKSEKTNLIKDEFYLPNAIVSAAERLNLKIKMLESQSSGWRGVTYAEDDAALNNYLAELTERGAYSKNLFE